MVVVSTLLVNSNVGLCARATLGCRRCVPGSCATAGIRVSGIRPNKSRAQSKATRNERR